MSINSLDDITKLLQKGVTDFSNYGNVYTKESGGLILFNYTDKAVYSGEWNFLEQVSRGLIINKKTGEIVARPFDKFFNWFEKGKKSNGHIVSITEKIDGSLGILYRDNGQFKVATRGSFDGEQAIWGTNYLNNNHDLSMLPDELTLLFEIVYKKNRVVIEYDFEGLVLLAARNRFTGEYLPFYPDVFNLGEVYGFSLPKVYNFNNVTQILENTGQLPGTSEGYVVEFSDGQRFKFKGDRYLELHKAISSLSLKNTLEAVEKGDVQRILETIPDEFLDEFKAWVKLIEFEFSALKNSVELAYSQAPLDLPRPQITQWVKINCPQFSSYLFALLDGKNIDSMIYKQLKTQLKDG
jgi:RNA ligase